MKTILVLGSWGFLGSNLLLAIERRFQGACKIIAFDRQKDHPLHLSCPAVKKVYSGDFQDANVFQPIFTENKIDTVIHLVSTTIPATSANVRFDVETNLLPTIDLLDQMAQHKVRRIVYISSGGVVYGPSPARRREIDEAFPINSYGAVKLAIEKYLFMYAHQHNILPLVVRLSNPYGPYHVNRAQGVINVALRAAIRGEPVQMWGDGTNKKDYIFVEDCVEAILDLVAAEAWGQIVNIGSGQEHSLLDIFRIVAEIVPGFSWHQTKARAFDTRNFSLDISKLQKLCGQRFFTDIHVGIQKTHSWLMQHPEAV